MIAISLIYYGLYYNFIMCKLNLQHDTAFDHNKTKQNLILQA